MICALTARRLAPGATDAFRAAFEGGVADMPDEVKKRFRRVYVCRDVTDENVILTFGLFDGTLDELRELQGRGDREAQLAGIAPHVQDVLLDGSYEVLEEIEP
jgi:hypothetical protein